MPEEKDYLLEEDFARYIAKRTGRTIRSCRSFTRDFLEALMAIVQEERCLKFYRYLSLDYLDIPERELLDPQGRPTKVEAHKYPRIRIAIKQYKAEKPSHAKKKKKAKG